MPETNNATIRAMVLTIFGDRMPPWDKLSEKLKYFAYSEEIAPMTGTPHKQAFAYAWKPMRLSTWRKLFPEVRMDTMRGSFRENEVYCSKQGRLIEFGARPEENGQKTSLLGMKRKLEEGATVFELAKQDEYHVTYQMYRNGLHEYKRNLVNEALENVGFRKPELYIRYGAAGTGKTRWVYDQYGHKNVTVICGNMLRKGWFPSTIRDVVLFDDVEAGSIMSLSDFKNLTDGNCREVEFKGGTTLWHPKVIVFTSNHHPDTWWPNLTEDDRAAIQRRITRLSKLTIMNPLSIKADHITLTP